MSGILLIQAKCEDGENLEVSTEWDNISPEKMIGAFVALGVKIGVDLCGENAQAFYKMVGAAFQRLQDKEVLEDVLAMVEGE